MVTPVKKAQKMYYYHRNPFEDFKLVEHDPGWFAPGTTISLPKRLTKKQLNAMSSRSRTAEKMFLRTVLDLR